MTTAEKFPQGRKAKVITDEMRQQVELLSGYGLNQTQIAAVMKMDRGTLAKHFSEELEVGKANAMVIAVQALFYNIKKRKEASIFFYLKTQHGWKEGAQLDPQAQLPDKIQVEIIRKQKGDNT